MEARSLHAHQGQRQDAKAFQKKLPIVLIWTPESSQHMMSLPRHTSATAGLSWALENQWSIRAFN